jgi:glutamyl-tRNA reductase
VGRRVREETGLDRGRLSIASVAVDLAREVFDSFQDKTVLVLGAGKMGEATLQHLTALRPRRVLVTNRSLERAQQAAGRWAAEPVPFERLTEALIAADLVVSTTASEEPVVGLELYARVQRARRNRLALILDIAVPRDFDERIGELDQVLLYNVDDLRAQVDRNREGRRRGIDPAQAIIEEETQACLEALNHRRHAGALLRELGAYADAVRTRELEKLFARCPDLSDDQRGVIAQFALRLQNQYLHHPRTALKAAAVPGPEEPGGRAREPRLVETVRQLFGLGHGSG